MDLGAEAAAGGIRLFLARARPCGPITRRTDPGRPAWRPSGAARRLGRTRRPGNDRPRPFPAPIISAPTATRRTAKMIQNQYNQAGFHPKQILSARSLRIPYAQRYASVSVLPSNQFPVGDGSISIRLLYRAKNQRSCERRRGILTLSLKTVSSWPVVNLGYAFTHCGHEKIGTSN